MVGGAPERHLQWSHEIGKLEDSEKLSEAFEIKEQESKN